MFQWEAMVSLEGGESSFVGGKDRQGSGPVGLCLYSHGHNSLGFSKGAMNWQF